jgi:hypothetical protein
MNLCAQIRVYVVTNIKATVLNTDHSDDLET